MPGTTRVAAICLALLVSAGPGEPPDALASQSPATDAPAAEAASPSPQEPTEVTPDPAAAAADPAVSPEAEEPFATLVLTADSPCTVYLNDAPVVAIASPDESHEVAIHTSVIKLAAISSAVLGARFDTPEEEFLVLEKDEVREFAIPMLEAIEELRKVERRDRVFRDLKTGLMWQRTDNAADVTWARAESYCQDLELGAYLNWRMPSAPELETLEAMWSIRPHKIADPIFLSSCCIWSDTKPKEGTAYSLDFRYRRRFETNQHLSYSLRALCAREMMASEVADALLAAEPKEQKRRLKEKRLRLDERKRRKAERAAEKAAKQSAKQAAKQPDGR